MCAGCTQASNHVPFYWPGIMVLKTTQSSWISFLSRHGWTWWDQQNCWFTKFRLLHRCINAMWMINYRFSISLHIIQCINASEALVVAPIWTIWIFLFCIDLPPILNSFYSNINPWSRDMQCLDCQNPMKVEMLSGLRIVYLCTKLHKPL